MTIWCSWSNYLMCAINQHLFLMERHLSTFLIGILIKIIHTLLQFYYYVFINFYVLYVYFAWTHFMKLSYLIVSYLIMLQKLFYFFLGYLCVRAWLILIAFYVMLFISFTFYYSPPNTDGALGSCLMLWGLCIMLWYYCLYHDTLALLLFWRRWNYKIGGRSRRRTR